MSHERIYLSTTIPYVNAPVRTSGHALELVQADVLARHTGWPATRSGSRPAPTTTR